MSEFFDTLQDLVAAYGEAAQAGLGTESAIKAKAALFDHVSVLLGRTKDAERLAAESRDALLAAQVALDTAKEDLRRLRKRDPYAPYEDPPPERANPEPLPQKADPAPKDPDPKKK